MSLGAVAASSVLLGACARVGEDASAPDAGPDRGDAAGAPGNEDSHSDERSSADGDAEGGTMDAYDSYSRQADAYAEQYAGSFQTHTVDGKDVFTHVPDGAVNAPLVLFMCGTNGNPRGDAAWSGWLKESDEQGFALVAPDYDNYVTYGETDFLNDVVDWALEALPTDETRVYSTGFSNGGAISVAMANDYPNRIAAISAAGWMVGLRQVQGPAMPFQLIQGQGEFTGETETGAAQVMADERQAIHDLMLRDELIGETEEANYDANPYWGYAPDSTSSEEAGGFNWWYAHYAKDGFDSPFAQLVLVSDSLHRPRPDEARIAWEFLRHFSRGSSGLAEM